MKCRNRGRVPNFFFFFKGCSPYKSTLGFRGLHPPITRLKNRLSVAPLESRPFEASVVVAVGRAFVLIAPASDLYDLRAILSTPLLYRLVVTKAFRVCSRGEPSYLSSQI